MPITNLSLHSPSRCISRTQASSIISFPALYPAASLQARNFQASPANQPILFLPQRCKHLPWWPVMIHHPSCILTPLPCDRLADNCASSSQSLTVMAALSSLVTVPPSPGSPAMARSQRKLASTSPSPSWWMSTFQRPTSATAIALSAVLTLSSVSARHALRQYGWLLLFPGTLIK